MKTKYTLIATLVAGVALSACGGAPKKIESLETARAAYERAAADPSVARHAPKELDAAKTALADADRDFREEESRWRIDSNANLALKRVQTAELIAKSREDQRETEEMKLERQRVQLDLRAAEIERSKEEVARSQAEAEASQAEAEAARLAAAELQQQLEDLEAERTERGIVLTLSDVLFASNEAVLEPGAARNIQKIDEFMKSYPEREAVIEGHTDSVGDEDYNLGLSRDRAFAVRQALVGEGIPAYRISTQGFGEAIPVASNQSRDGRQQNRRVEVIFPDAPGQVSQLGQ